MGRWGDEPEEANGGEEPEAQLRCSSRGSSSRREPGHLLSRNLRHQMDVLTQKCDQVSHTQQAGRICLEQALRFASFNTGPVEVETNWRASQFDPAIDKEKIISSLRWNMPVLHQTVPNVRL
jgi:hypothetical protein